MLKCSLGCFNVSIGALYGVKAIPERWLTGLELCEVIQSVAIDLLRWPDWQLGSLTDADGAALWQRYPGW